MKIPTVIPALAREPHAVRVSVNTTASNPYIQTGAGTSISIDTVNETLSAYMVRFDTDGSVSMVPAECVTLI